MTITATDASLTPVGTPTNVNNFEPSVSSDGTKVLYLGGPAANQILLFNATTNTTLDIGAAIGLPNNNIAPVLSFDGSTAAYDNFTGPFEIVIENTGNFATRFIIDAFGPSLSDNGSKVAYTDFSTGPFIATVDPGGGRPPVTFGTNTQADAISGNGNFVALETTNGAQFGVATGNNNELFLGNVLAGGNPTLVSVNTSGQFADNAAHNSASTAASLSDDGSAIVFQSNATNLAFDGAGNAVATNGNNEIYLRTGSTTKLISRTATGAAADGNSTAPVISSDGKFVAFTSTADNLVPGANGAAGTQVYVYSVAQDTVTLLSQTPLGAVGNGASQSSTFIPGFFAGTGAAFSADDTKTVFTTQANNLVTGASNVTQQIALATATASTITLDPVAGDGIVNAAEAAAGVAVTGTTTGAVGDTVTLYLNGASGAAVGSGTVGGDGKFKATLTPAAAAALAQGSNSILATVQGGPTLSYLSGSDTKTFGVDTVAPTPTITSAGTTSNQPNQTLTGTGEANTHIALFDNGGTTPVGSATVDGTGHWTTQVTLPNQGANAITAVDTDAAGNSGTSAPVTFTLSTIPPAVSIFQGVQFNDRTHDTIFGTVSVPGGLANLDHVELFDNLNNSGTLKDLGRAQVNPDGSYSLKATFTPGDHFLNAVAIDTLGNQTSAGAPFLLVTGIRGAFNTVEYDVNPATGAPTEDTYYGPRGVVYLHDTDTTLDNGNIRIDYDRGTFFKDQPYSSYSDLLNSAGYGLTETLNNKDGTHTVTGLRNGQTLHALGDDTMTGGGRNETFLFGRTFGDGVVTDFTATGAGHDTLSFSRQSFHSVGDILNNATTNGNDVVISTPNGQNSVTLQNVSLADLQSHPRDFTLHA